MTNFKSCFVASAALTLIHGASAGVARRWGTPAGPFCTDFTPFTYAGCFAEGVNARALPFISDIATDNMNVQTCVSFCKGNGYRYAGLEYYGECYCGASVAGVQVDDALCNLPCTGNKTQACGGNSILSVYQDPTFPSRDTTTVADYQSSGCYTDSGNGRTLVYRQDKLDGATLTVEKCLFSCKNAGYPLAGVEYGSECYCGVVLGNGTQKVDASECNKSCNGDASQTCGGAARLNLYVAKDLESSEPCNFGPVSSSSTTSQSSTTPPYTLSTSTTVPATTTTAPTTTSAPVTSPPSTTKTPTSTKTTTSVALCTTTVAPTCEYKCGSWCSDPLPPWNSHSDCKVAASQCLLQVAACFAHAKFPDSLKCFEFSGWCKDVSSYCSNTCAWGKCSKDDCKSKNPPPSYPAPTPSTSVYPCPVTTAPPSTTAKPTSTTSCSTVPVPTSSNICVQPHNPGKGYTKDKPCGGIALPCLTCNNKKDEYDSDLKFKLYTYKDSSKCSAYKKPTIPQACKDACLGQYNSCVGTYAESCKDKKHKREATWGWGNWGSWWGNHDDDNDDYDHAKQKCKDQYEDCLEANQWASAGNRCGSWNSGWA